MVPTEHQHPTSGSEVSRRDVPEGSEVPPSEEKAQKHPHLSENPPWGMAALLDLTSWAYYSLDVSGRLVEVSDSFAELLNTSTDNLLGMPLTSLCMPPHDSLLAERLVKLADSHQPQADRLHLCLALRPASDQQTMLPVEIRATLLHPKPANTDIAIVGLMRPLEPDPQSTIHETHQLKEISLQYAKQLQAIARIGQKVAAVKDLNTLLGYLVDLLRDELNCPFVDIYLLDEDEDQFVSRTVTTTAHVGDPIQDEGRDPLKNGIVGRVASSGDVLMINDLSGFPYDLSSLRSDAKSALAVPMIASGRVVGVVAVQSDCEDAFTLDDLILMQTLADYGAVAVENASLLEERDQHLAELSALSQIGLLLGTPMKPMETLNAIIQHVNALFQVEAVSLMLIEEGKLHFKVMTGEHTEEVKRHTLEIGQGIAGWAVQHNRTARVNKASEDPRHHDEIDQATQFDTRSLIAAPLRLAKQPTAIQDGATEDRVIGVIEIINRLDGRPFTRSDEVLLEFIASSAAVVIENVRLRTENEQLLDSLRDRAIKLEQMLEELRELNQHKAEFVQNVSHELRMPLTFVKAYVQLMLEEAMGELTDDMKQTLSVVNQRTETVIRLVNDMISLEKVEVGIMEFEPTSLADVASTAARGAAMPAEKANLRLTLTVDDNLPLVHADPGRLGQVFDNLLGNAIKFSPEGGVISVRVFRDGNFIRADVKDQGIGIPADKLDRIFDRFYQVDGSTTRRFGGTGLGLAIVKSIIEAHGGKVTVISELHVGSTFSFLLPIPRNRD